MMISVRQNVFEVFEIYSTGFCDTFSSPSAMRCPNFIGLFKGVPSLLYWSGVKCKSWHYKIKTQYTKSGSDLSLEDDAGIYKIETQLVQLTAEQKNTRIHRKAELSAVLYFVLITLK